MPVRRAIRMSAAVGLGLGAALAVPAPAQAAPSDRFPVEFHGSGTVDCGTFQDNYVDDLYGVATEFFDAAGQPLRLVIHWVHTSTDTNSVTGFTLHEHGHATETIDLRTGTDTFTGSFEIMNRRGVGVVLQDTGRQIWDADGNLVFFAGGRKHSGDLLGDQPYCEALG